MEIKNSTFIVTGGASGLGAATARTIAAAGGNVVIADVNADAGNALAKELGPRNIRVNAINPGMVETEGVHTAGFIESDFRKQLESQTPLGRIGQPEDVAPAAVFFASSDAAWITGETLVVAGGLR